MTTIDEQIKKIQEELKELTPQKERWFQLIEALKILREVKQSE